MRQPLRFHPVVELVDPVITRCALFAHTPAMTALAEDVKLRFVSGRFECVVEGDDVSAGKIVVLRHRHEEGRQSSWYRRYMRDRSAVNRSRVVRARARIRLYGREISDHPAGGESRED